jgi:hypothetical protein
MLPQLLCGGTELMTSTTPDTLWHAIPCGADSNRAGNVLVSAAVSAAADAQGAMPPVWQNWPDSVNSAFNYSVDFFDGNNWTPLDSQAKPVSVASPDLWALLFPEGKDRAKQVARSPQPNVNLDLPPVTHRAGALHSNLNRLRGLQLIYQLAAAMTRYEGKNHPLYDLVGDGSQLFTDVKSALESVALAKYPKPQPDPQNPYQLLAQGPDADQVQFEHWVRAGLASGNTLQMARVRTAERNLYRLSARPYDNNLRGSVFRRIQQALDPASVSAASVPAAGTFEAMVAGLRTQAQDASVFHGRSSAPPPCSTTPESYDWAQKIALLGNYPNLMRLLGLVIDFSVRAPTNLAGQIRVVAKDKKYGSVVRNSVTVTDKRFFAAAGQDNLLDRGALNLQRRVKLNDEFDDAATDQPEYELVYLDVDGDALKTLQAADSRARSQGNFATSRTLELDSDNVQNALPAARSAGLALVRNGHAAATVEKYKKDTAKRQNVESGGVELLYGPDLLRGYIPEIRLVARANGDHCGAKHTSDWLCLTERHESFVGLNLTHLNNTSTCANAPPTDFANALSILRWSGTTTSDAPGGQPVDADLHIHEILFRWRGWSLGVPQPIVAIPGDQCAAQKTFPFTLKTEVPPGSLPPLRFGATYEMRVRTMDMACRISEVADDLPSLKRKFLRYQPVSPPLVLLEAPIKESDSPGEGVDLILLRDGATHDEKAKAPEPFRTLVPARVNLDMAELHGCFDQASPFSIGSFEAAKLVCPSQGPADHLDFPEDLTPDRADATKMRGSGNKLYQPPTEQPPPSAYYPDPLADRMVAEVFDVTRGKILPPGVDLAFYPDDDWPKAVRHRISLQNSSWPSTGVHEYEFPRPVGFGGSPTEKVQCFAVGLPPGWKVIVRLRSRMDDEKRCLMATDPLFESSRPLLLESLRASRDVDQLVEKLLTTARQKVKDYDLDSLTPARELTMVHAVVKPLMNPAITNLCAIRQLADPGVDLLLRVEADRKSTGRIDIQAEWDELDDTALEGLKRRHATAKVDAQPSPDPNRRGQDPQPSSTRQAFISVPEEPQCGEDPRHRVRIENPSLQDVACSDDSRFVHRFREVFPDTIHRYVTYSAVGTSRFQRFYVEQLEPKRFQVSGVEKDEVWHEHIRSTSRPPAPDIAYVVPIFNWKREKGGHGVESTRTGGGLRIYLNRPWYKSGDNEKLGVVLWGETGSASVAPSGGQDSCMKVPSETFSGDRGDLLLRRYITRWGADPTLSDSVRLLAPVSSMFMHEETKIEDKTFIAGEVIHGLSLDEVEPHLTQPGISNQLAMQHPVTIVTYDPLWDNVKRLWYCDVSLNQVPAYSCFIRLALVRYQPFSLRHTECSHVSIATFAQLPANRSVMVQREDDHAFSVKLRGTRPGTTELSHDHPNEFHLVVERARPHIFGQDQWETDGAETVQIGASDANDPDLLCEKTIKHKHSNGRMRLIVREYEWLNADKDVDAGTFEPRTRLVFGDVLELP